MLSAMAQCKMQNANIKMQNLSKHKFDFCILQSSFCNGAKRLSCPLGNTDKLKLREYKLLQEVRGMLGIITQCKMQNANCKMLEYLFKVNIIILTFALCNLHFALERSDYLALR